MQKTQAPVIAALTSETRDGTYPAWSDTYLRDVVSAQAADFGDRINDALLAAVPAAYVSDPGYDFGAKGGKIDLYAELGRGDAARRKTLDSILADLLGHFGAHSRNAIRALLANPAKAASR